MPRMTHVSLRHRPLRLQLQNLGATSRYNTHQQIGKDPVALSFTVISGISSGHYHVADRGTATV